MKVYIGKVDCEIKPEKAFTSLKELCDELEVSYHSAAKGKRIWFEKDKIKMVFELPVQRIKNRGKK